MNTGLIILIVVLSIVGAILLVVGYLLLDKYFFSKKRCRRNLKALERKFEYLHGCNFRDWKEIWLWVFNSRLSR